MTTVKEVIDEFSWDARASSYFAFSPPDVSLIVDKTGSMKQISKDDLFLNMPSWAKSAYSDMYGSKWQSILSQ